MSLVDKIKGKKKKSIEGEIIIDNPDIKVATVSYEGKPFVMGIGTTQERQVEGEAVLELPKGGKGKYQTQKALKWKVLYDPKVFPNLMPLEDLKDFAASSVAVASGSFDVLRTAEFSETKPERLKRIGRRLATAEGRDPFELLREEGWELNHVKPLKNGGTSEADNLRVIRRKAHRRTS